jgi:NAD(P)-dependent dehydrogenase (short-subunit alcohol dehydrogenase family)
MLRESGRQGRVHRRRGGRSRPRSRGPAGAEGAGIIAVDISHALLFLASDEARFITGVTLPVDAGFMAEW